MPDPEPSADDIDAFRRRAAELLRRQRAGQLPPPGEISRDALAEWFGIAPRTIRRIERKFRHRLIQTCPELRDLKSHLNHQP